MKNWEKCCPCFASFAFSSSSPSSPDPFVRRRLVVRLVHRADRHHEQRILEGAARGRGVHRVSAPCHGAMFMSLLRSAWKVRRSSGLV